MKKPLRLGLKTGLATGVAVYAGCASPPPMSPDEVQHADQARVESVIVSHRKDFSDCYEASPKRATGQVTVQFRVGPSGKAEQPGVGMTTLADSEVEKCLVNKLEGTRFSSPVGGGTAEVQYTFKFSRAKGLFSLTPR